MSSVPEPSLLFSRRDPLIVISALAFSAGLLSGPAQGIEPATLELPAGGTSVGHVTTDGNVHTVYRDWGLRLAQPIDFHHGCAER